MISKILVAAALALIASAPLGAETRPTQPGQAEAVRAAGAQKMRMVRYTYSSSNGNLTAFHITQSSGDPRVDALVKEGLRRCAAYKVDTSAEMDYCMGKAAPIIAKYVEAIIRKDMAARK